MSGEANVPAIIPNWVAGQEDLAQAGGVFDKLAPATGKLLWRVTRSLATDVDRAVAVARTAQTGWAQVPPVQRGHILHQACNMLEARAAEIARIVAAETGKSFKDAMGETGGAIALGRFYAGEGQRLYGRTTTSGVANKYAMTVRIPCGVAALITAANTPIANVAWKTFPALICGNAVVLKGAEDTPATTWIFTAILHAAGVPAGVLNSLQGLGSEAGEALLQNKDIDVLSFTGSTAVGKHIAEVGGRRVLKVSLELGGKNPLIVCDDADLDNAVKWTCLSAYSNAGQRCAAASRIIIFESVYDAFVQKLLAATAAQKVGSENSDDFGPVINARQLDRMVNCLASAQARGAKILAGGGRLTGGKYEGGFYMAPTVVEAVTPDDELSHTELFGSIAVLYRARDYADALAMVDKSDYALTASIHTRNFSRAMHFAQTVKSGVAVVNAGTFGSEPHMPFGGPKRSGNGTREPGTEALDIYSDLKDIYLIVDPAQF